MYTLYTCAHIEPTARYIAAAIDMQRKFSIKDVTPRARTRQRGHERRVSSMGEVKVIYACVCSLYIGGASVCAGVEYRRGWYVFLSSLQGVNGYRF